MNDQKPRPPDQKNNRKPEPNQKYWFWLPMILFWIWLWQGLFQITSITTIPYSAFKNYLAAKNVEEVLITEGEITGLLKVGSPLPASASPRNEGQDPWYESLLPPRQQPDPTREAATPNAPEPATKPHPFRTVRVEDPQLAQELSQAGVKYAGSRPSLFSQMIWSWILPFLLIFILWSWLARRFSAGLGSASLGLGKSRAKLHVDQETGVTFDDVAGCDEAKHELEEIVDFLKNPTPYKRLGASIPRGVLLVGPPGTGKTLLARAVAGQARVPFFSISGSDFVEMFVGVGAARVRDLFAEAKKKAPCIIFIDEIDTIGRQRSVQVAVSNDEREQTLNQLLSEMDGFEPTTELIILAATNRPEILDPALLRPGRFDRQVVIDAPDKQGREAIFRVHARRKPLAADVNFSQLAAETPGLSGADIANIVNEAALLATQRKKSAISHIDFSDAIEKVLAGPEKKSRRLGDEERRRVAYHETGHALVAAFSKHADPLRKISIVPRGKAALGYTLQVPENEKYILTREALLDQIRGLLGGRAAEELIFDEISTGAENDLDRATAIAQQMICFYGMGSLGLAHYGERRPLYLAAGDTIARNCSPETGRRIDEEVEQILRDSYEDASRILEQNRPALEAIAKELLYREVIEGAEFNKILARYTKSQRPPSAS